MNEIPKSLLVQVGAKVAYYRRINGLSQRALAEKVHVTPSVISRLERGTYSATLSTPLILEIAEQLKADPRWFITFTDLEMERWESTKPKKA